MQRLFRSKKLLFAFSLVAGCLTFHQFVLESLIVNYNTSKYTAINLQPLQINKSQSGMKKILFYTPFFSRSDYSFGFGHEPFEAHQCKVTNCLSTNNRELLSNLLYCYILHSGMFRKVLFRCENVCRQRDFVNF